ELWQRHEVGKRFSDHKILIHPELGPIELDCQALFTEDQSHALLVLTEAPPSTGPGGARQASRHGRRNCAVPSAPGNVTASGSANAATVTWTAPSGNGTALDAYVLRAVSGPDLGQSVS